MERELIRTAKVAALLHTSDKTIARWTNEGKIPVAFTTLGGHRLYDLAVIERLAESLVGGRES